MSRQVEPGQAHPRQVEPGQVHDGQVDPADLGERLRGLDGAPVHAHPDVLDEVHRALVSELESLAGAGSVRAAGAA